MLMPVSSRSREAWRLDKRGSIIPPEPSGDEIFALSQVGRTSPLMRVLNEGFEVIWFIKY